jgi:hypothetical protein
VPGEVARLLEVVRVDARELVVECRDVIGQEADEAERLSLVGREGGPLVEDRIGEEVGAALGDVEEVVHRGPF